MAPKKRNHASRSKPCTAAGEGPSSVVIESSQIVEYNENSKIEAPIEWNASSYTAVKLECERALTALRRGNYTKALRIMKDLCARPENSFHLALIHRVQGTVCLKVSSIMDDPNVKQRHLKNAIESARKAASLSPNSIEFSHFYANLLYEAAKDGKEYEEVVQECQRAMSIENPVDPAKESLQDESQQKIPTADARIAHVRQELDALVQKSSIASISAWMKNLGNGEEKFRLIPLRRPSEDPMEAQLVQARRPNEIKKATKTLEDRRKDIEVQVAAARLLQQKSELPQSNHEKPKTLDSSLGGNQRSRECRKSGNARKKVSSAERKDLVCAFWKTAVMDVKKDFLRVRISDLKAHYSSLKDGLASEVLLEALSYAGANKKWKFWSCCRCSETFPDSESHMQHVVQEHMGNLLPKMQSVLPENVGNEWIEMLLSCSWKPLDVIAAVKMLENQSKCQYSQFVDELDVENSPESNVFFKGAGDSSLVTVDAGDSRNGSTVKGRDFDKLSHIDWRECDWNHGPKENFISSRWPLSDDSECANLLERIRSIFGVLIRHKYLAVSHLNKVIQFSMDELQGLASGSQLLNYGLDQTPLCICFLGTSQLNKVLKFLKEISLSCGLSRYAEKTSMPSDESTAQGSEIKENIVLNGDASYLLLDEHLLPKELTASMSNGSVAVSQAALGSATATCENGVLTEKDTLLSWIFTGPTSGEELELWAHAKDEKAHQGMEILQMLEKEFYHLQDLCERKCDHLAYEEALQAVEDICLEESKKRENVAEFGQRSYESVLRKRLEELEIETNNTFELNAVRTVLREADALNANHFGYKETYSGGASHLHDLESCEDEDRRMKDYLHQVDAAVEVSIQRQKEQSSIELSKIDARIMRNVIGMQQLELNLEPVSAHDYQSILLSLVKSFLRARLEDMAEKDATEKSDAAREAFLAELALDSKKGGHSGSGNPRHVQEKMKDKKKNKEFRKNKDPKETGISEQHMIHHELAECISFPDHSDSEVINSVSSYDLKQQEEELRRKLELEAEERKLEETLGYQRQIEHEAKQKHLAEQHKRAIKTFPLNVVEAMPDVYQKHDLDDHNLQEQQSMLAKQELWAQNQGYSLNSEDMPPNSLEEVEAIVHYRSISNPESSCSTENHSPMEVKQGLPNGGTLVGNALPVDRRARRKGKWQKNSLKSAHGRHQTLPSKRENLKVGISHVDDSSEEQIKLQAGLNSNGTKSLRQLQAEDDDEERFQADLKKAVCQSLDTFEAHQKLPLVSSLKMLPKMFPEASNGALPNDIMIGTGLKNEVGEYNCFLNVIIQSLWHLRQFSDGFMSKSTSEHVHVGDPCVVCALYDVFTALSLASTAIRRETVAPTSLRIALSNLFPDSNFFLEAQMNDASEVLGVIFNCLHQSFTSGSGTINPESVESNWAGAWDCTSNACIVHSLFGMNIFERMNCFSCGLESRHLKYTSFFHNINASALRAVKATCAESSFDEVLNLVEMNHQIACDPEAGGCGKLNYIHHILSIPPPVFTIVLGWQNTSESADDIMATLAALSTEIDIGVLYRGLDPKITYHLVSVVCYYGQHYHCFAYNYDSKRWIMYDDKIVKVIGDWSDVITMCGRGHLQPQVLFFEAVN